jgi:hypothetical protein
MTDDFRRHPGGSIDFDFYRSQAVALRRQAMREAATLRTASAGALVMAGAIGFAVVISSIATPAHDRLAAAWSRSIHVR